MQFDQCEEKVLHKGLKQSFPPFDANDTHTNLVTDLRIRISPTSNVHNSIAETLHTTPIPTLDSSIEAKIRSMKRKIIDNEIVVTKADKGDVIVN